MSLVSFYTLWKCQKISRQGNYCNNFATRIVSFFLSRNHQEVKQFPKPSHHIFLETPSLRYWWGHSLRSPQKLYVQTCLNYISLKCSLCTDQFLIKAYRFKMQGKWDIASDTKCFDVIIGRKEKIFFFPSIAILYIIRKSFITNHSLLKDYNLKVC